MICALMSQSIHCWREKRRLPSLSCSFFCSFCSFSLNNYCPIKLEKDYFSLDTACKEGNSLRIFKNRVPTLVGGRPPAIAPWQIHEDSHLFALVNHFLSCQTRELKKLLHLVHRLSFFCLHHKITNDLRMGKTPIPIFDGGS